MSQQNISNIIKSDRVRGWNDIANDLKFLYDLCLKEALNDIDRLLSSPQVEVKFSIKNGLINKNLSDPLNHYLLNNITTNSFIKFGTNIDFYIPISKDTLPVYYGYMIYICEFLSHSFILTAGKHFVEFNNFIEEKNDILYTHTDLGNPIQILIDSLQTLMDVLTSFRYQVDESTDTISKFYEFLLFLVQENPNASNAKDSSELAHLGTASFGTWALLRNSGTSIKNIFIYNPELRNEVLYGPRYARAVVSFPMQAPLDLYHAPLDIQRTS